MNFQLTLRAKNDLKNIALYTQETWGLKQRNFYLDQIDDAFHLIAKSYKLGESCDYIKEGYRKYSFKKHIIFYRKISQSDIQIVRILHSSMDATKHI
ncbi:MAG: type II toxin-antitoxin system RelE/ParE family toxin [Proteobacteria bacterium]|nr:type II toxin-antitoxin system RelE/ParE family toxin [Pseudomonadota bacterium]